MKDAGRSSPALIDGCDRVADLGYRRPEMDVRFARSSHHHPAAPPRRVASPRRGGR